MKSIVRNQGVRYPEPVDDVFADELGQVILGVGQQRNSLGPLGEVIYYHDGKFKPSGRRRQGSSNVDSPLREGPQTKDYREPFRMCSNKCRVPLTLVALPRVIGGILLHRGPIKSLQ